jgi:hypothetical protein
MYAIIYFIIIVQFILINGKTEVIKIISDEKNHHLIVQNTIDEYATKENGCVYSNSNLVYVNYKLITMLYMHCNEPEPIRVQTFISTLSEQS